MLKAKLAAAKARAIAKKVDKKKSPRKPVLDEDVLTRIFSRIDDRNNFLVKSFKESQVATPFRKRQLIPVGNMLSLLETVLNGPLHTWVY